MTEQAHQARKIAEVETKHTSQLKALEENLAALKNENINLRTDLETTKEQSKSNYLFHTA